MLNRPSVLMRVALDAIWNFVCNKISVFPQLPPDLHNPSGYLLAPFFIHAIMFSARIFRANVFCRSHVRCAARQSELCVQYKKKRTTAA